MNVINVIKKLMLFLILKVLKESLDASRNDISTLKKERLVQNRPF